LVLLTPELDPAVDGWRRRYDPSAAWGVPAHVTVLYPWKQVEEVTADDRTALGELCRDLPALELVFERMGRFSETLWLDPQPTQPIRALIDVVGAQWPLYPPYGGMFDEVIPHLTVADGHQPGALTALVGDLERQLPLRTSVGALTLMRLAGDRWVVDSAFPFGG
jgi:2'-5' RNA ligase